MFCGISEILRTSITLCPFPSEELLRSEHLGPSDLDAPVSGGSSEDKGGLPSVESKDGELA